MPRNYKTIWDKYPKTISQGINESYNPKSKSILKYLLIIASLLLFFVVLLGAGYGFWMLLNRFFE